MCEQAEVLLAKLEQEQKKWTDWVALGTVDLDEFCDSHMDEVEDWKINFDMIKQAAKDVERLPAEAKHDCYLVNLTPVKKEVEEMLKQLREVCAFDSLHKAVRTDASLLEGPRAPPPLAHSSTPRV